MATLKNKKELEKLEKNISKKEKEIETLKKEIETLSNRYNELLIDEIKVYSLENNKSMIDVVSDLLGNKNKVKTVTPDEETKPDLDSLIGESIEAINEEENKENEFDVTSVLGNITSGTRGY